jgi:glycosyltransferase involved in cell wall biosynthesis
MYNVLHSITGLNVGGAESMMLTFVGSLDRKEWRTEILSLMPPGPLQARADALGVAVRSAGMAQGRPGLAAMGVVRRAFRDFKPHIAHGWMYHGNLAATFGAMRSGRRTPVIWSIHHSLSDFAREKPMTRAVIRLSAAASGAPAAISFCSRISAEQHRRIGFRPRRQAVIPNGTDCDRFKPCPDARDRLLTLIGASRDAILVGHVGRAHPMKDQVRLVEALGSLLRDGYSVHGVIIGAGHHGGAVERAVREVGIAGNVSLLGLRDDIAELAPGMDLFVLSSAWGEAFPLAAAEAMASGVPVVATDVGDCSWLVADTGGIARPSDTESLVAAMKSLLDLTTDDRRALGARARRRVIEEFGLDQYVRRHLDLYEEALDESKAQIADRSAFAGRYFV